MSHNNPKVGRLQWSAERNVAAARSSYEELQIFYTNGIDMKRKLTALLLMLLCALPGLFAHTRAELLKKAQAGDAGAQHDLAYCYQNSSSHFDLKRDERVVENYIVQSNSHAAATYLKKLFENDQYPEDADVMFGYACLIQKLLVQIGNEGAQAVASMDLMSSMTITIDQQNMNNLHIALLFLAANKGHRGAYQLLQLKVAMQGGGGANFQPSNSGSSGSVVGSKTCSLCNGRGWIAGSKTVTYGSGGTYWCSECLRNVGASHSHDRCPSCGGRGTVPTIN